jgi:hypothetical protein
MLTGKDFCSPARAHLRRVIEAIPSGEFHVELAR